jgi:hypothetical protein
MGLLFAWEQNWGENLTARKKNISISNVLQPPFLHYRTQTNISKSNVLPTFIFIFFFFRRLLSFGLVTVTPHGACTLIKKKRKFSLYIRKFRMEKLQSHKWLTASSYMKKFFGISSYIRKPFFIYDLATAPLWISLFVRKILFSFLSVHHWLLCGYPISGDSYQDAGQSHRIESGTYTYSVVARRANNPASHIFSTFMFVLQPIPE